MKKIMTLVILLVLSGCVAGEFTPERNRLHDMNSDRDICSREPERCISGVAVK